jgi:hypothetical protein
VNFIVTIARGGGRTKTSLAFCVNFESAEGNGT